MSTYRLVPQACLCVEVGARAAFSEAEFRTLFAIYELSGGCPGVEVAAEVATARAEELYRLGQAEFDSLLIATVRKAQGGRRGEN